MIYVFAAGLCRLYEKDVYDAYYQKLPAWRKAKADRLKKEDGKVQCVGAWTLWQKVQEILGLEASLESEEELLALSYMNLSHSGRYVLCAVNVPAHESAVETRKVQVGCDLEKIRPLRLNVAKRNFCPSEYEHIVSQETEEEKTELFYRYWVLKESFIKATREGIGRPLNSFQTIWKDGHAFMAEELETEEAEKKKFYYKEYTLGEEYRVAACATASTFSPELHILEL